MLISKWFEFRFFSCAAFYCRFEQSELSAKFPQFQVAIGREVNQGASRGRLNLASQRVKDLLFRQDANSINIPIAAELSGGWFAVGDNSTR